MNMGLNPIDFWNMTLIDYFRMVIYRSKQEASKWEKTRTILSYILNTQVEKKHQKKPKDILPLWTDRLTSTIKGTLKKAKPISEEEKEELLKRVGK